MLTNLAYWFRTYLALDVEPIKSTPDKPFPEKPVIPASPHKEIRDAVADFLADCELPFPVAQYGHEFYNSCCHTARSKGYPMDTYPSAPSLHHFIPGTVVTATTAYAHLDNKSTQILIALYTAFLIYLDDVIQNDVELVYRFNERFTLRQAQDDPVLDGFASLLHEFLSISDASSPM